MPNRIFLFGGVGTGKSTICAAIALFLHETKGLTPRLNVVGNPDGTRYLQNWLRQLRNNEFPPKTDRQVFARIDIGFVDRNRRERVGFTFFEVSGENLRFIDPTDLDHKNRNPQLDKWLDESDTIVLVGSVLPEEKHRYAMQNFIEYIEDRGIIKPTCLVLTEWDRLPEADRHSPLDVSLRLYSEATKLLADRLGEATILPFSIGDVKDKNTISRIDFDAGTMQLVKWILDSMRQRL